MFLDVQVGSKILTITLLARRSRHHAGTRYNKRGINLYGHVANEVESEQMISSEKSWVEGRGQISSFVSLRGSIPLFWRQSNPLAPKPDITIYKSEKDLASTKLHFEQLFKRYGTPIVCINLIKQTEKKPQEIIVGEEFQNCIGSLSVEFSSKFNYCALNYITYDFLSQLKSKVDVTADLFRLASGIVESFRWFYHDTVPEKFFHSLKPENVKKLQSGTVRINCIDCLDRTNVAQFCVGLAAMGNQLLELGIIESLLNWETRNFDLMKLLQKLYISQGDRIAHQYGGSGTMHKASLSKKGSSDSSGKVGNALTAIKRYYSNNFLDFDKQHAINVFLGCFIPSPDKAHIWDLEPEKPMYDVDFLYPTGDMKFSIPYGVKENLGSAFDFFFEEKYTPSSLTFFEEKLKCSYIKQVDITSLSRMSSFAELNKKFREKIARNMEFDFTIPSLTGSNLSYSSGKAVVHAGNDIIEEDIIPSDEIDTNDSTNARMETTDGYKDETLKLNTVNDGYTVQESNIENLSHNFQLESESIIQLKDSTSEYEDYVNIERVLHSGPQKSSLFKRAESDENAANLIKVMFNEIMSFRNNMDSRLREIEKAVKDSKFN